MTWAVRDRVKRGTGGFGRVDGRKMRKKWVSYGTFEIKRGREMGIRGETVSL